MEKSTNGKSVQDRNLLKPTREQVQEWVKKDLDSAHYLLGLILTKYPEIVEELGGSIYDNIMAKESGAAIDTAVPQAAETGLD